MIVINTLAPLVLIVALGAVLEHTRFAREGFFRQTNRLVFWVGLPCLLFYKTARPMDELGRALSVFLVLFAGMILCIGTGYAAAFFLRLSRKSIGTFVQGAFRGNLAYVGLPIVLFVMQQNGADSDSIAFLVIAPLIPLYNAGAIFVLIAGRHGKGTPLSEQIRSILFRTLTNPLFLSVVAGLLWSCTGWDIPLFAGRTLDGIGQMCLPLALLGVGASLDFNSLRGRIGYAAASAAIKVGVAPLTGYCIGLLMGLTRGEMMIAMIYLACPTALASFVMAEQMDADHSLASSIIVMSILFALPGLSLILLLT